MRRKRKLMGSWGYKWQHISKYNYKNNGKSKMFILLDYRHGNTYFLD